MFKIFQIFVYYYMINGAGNTYSANRDPIHRHLRVIDVFAIARMISIGPS